MVSVQIRRRTGVFLALFVTILSGLAALNYFNVIRYSPDLNLTVTLAAIGITISEIGLMSAMRHRAGGRELIAAIIVVLNLLPIVLTLLAYRQVSSDHLRASCSLR
jgi:uncharacterized membrane protein YidH (DUF202 family)